MKVFTSCWCGQETLHQKLIDIIIKLGYFKFNEYQVTADMQKISILYKISILVKL